MSGARAPSPALSGALTADLTVPDGEYVRFCHEVASTAGSLPSLDAGRLDAVLEGVDFDRLAAAAPAGLRSTLQRVDAGRLAVVEVIQRTADPGDLVPADFPPGWLPAFGTLVNAVVQRCDVDPRGP